MTDKQRPPTAAEGNQLDALNEAFDHLLSGLREGKSLFQAGNEAGREGAIHALESVIKFLSLFQPVLDEGLHASLATLLDGLLGLDDGAVAPLLKPIPHIGRPRASALRESFIGGAAFAVDRLCGAGLPAPEAREFVASVLRAEGITAARGRFPEVTEDTVRGWCDNVAVDVELKGEAAQTFSGLRGDPEASPPPGTDAELVRQFFRDRLTHVIRSIRALEKIAKPPG
jgi:hypothetical protein